MTAIQHKFDGAMLTISEIMLRVPAIPRTAIRQHLAAGRNTSAAMLSYDHRPALSDAGKRSRAVLEARGQRFIIGTKHGRARAAESGFSIDRDTTAKR